MECFVHVLSLAKLPAHRKRAVTATGVCFVQTKLTDHIAGPVTVRALLSGWSLQFIADRH
jgi:hypothetical protein